MCTRLAFQEPKYNLRHVDFNSWVFHSNNNYSLCFNCYLPQNPWGKKNYYILWLKISANEFYSYFKDFESLIHIYFSIQVATINNFKRGQENVFQARSTSFPLGACHELILSILLVTVRHSLLCPYFYFKQVMNQSLLITQLTDEWSHQ